jgi:hypothetical protein
MKVNTPSGWADAEPKKVNVGGVWKDVVSVKVNDGGVWKDTSTAPEVEPEVLTELRWRQIGPAEIEFTAWGGSGTYFYDFDGDEGSTETNAYGEKVHVHKYKYTGYKSPTCMDMAGNANQQGVKVSADIVVKSTWP